LFSLLSFDSSFSFSFIYSFRQVAGHKKWWFIPPTQTPYLKPSINVNGFSAHTHTLVGKGGAAPSPWLSKLVRYTTVLHPGDVLINPPWFWHGILNLGDKEKHDLVIGSPVRYKSGYNSKAAFKINILYSINAFIVLYWKYGNAALKPGFNINLQRDIANNRRVRENKDVKEEDTGGAQLPGGMAQGESLHPFDLAD
jgi:hypothetical protein